MHLVCECYGVPVEQDFKEMVMLVRAWIGVEI